MFSPAPPQTGWMCISELTLMIIWGSFFTTPTALAGTGKQLMEVEVINYYVNPTPNAGYAALRKEEDTF